jgi:hypothetical protein
MRIKRVFQYNAAEIGLEASTIASRSIDWKLWERRKRAAIFEKSSNIEMTVTYHIMNRVSQYGI